MPFHPVKVARRVTGGPGIKASSSEHEDLSEKTVSISMNQDAQRKYFGREVDPDSDRFTIERGAQTDLGKVKIALDTNGAIEVRRVMKGAIIFKLQAFPPVAPEKIKSMDCIVISQAAGEVVVRLPWTDGSRMAER